MPLKSHEDPQESELPDHLSSDVRYLSVSIGERSIEQIGSLERRLPSFVKIFNQLVMR
jgi:hypothetical protein